MSLITGVITILTNGSFFAKSQEPPSKGIKPGNLKRPHPT